MQSITHSPLPIEAYFVSNPYTCPARAVMALPHAAASWNLIWLSLPQVDLLLNKEASHTDACLEISMSMKVIIDDIREEPLLQEMLLKPVDQFLEWFQFDDAHEVYHCFQRLGGEAWVQTVYERAKQAIQHQADKLRPIRPVSRSGNVIFLGSPNRAVA